QMGDAQASAPYKWNFCVAAPTSGQKCGQSTRDNPYGGAPPYSFTIINGSLPTGLTLDAGTGLVSGTPPNTAASVDYPFTICAFDSDNNSVCQPTALWVERNHRGAAGPSAAMFPGPAVAVRASAIH
ncbi:MAG: Ig domain-containing protein, partial [Candidatus Binataceae bacterium]